MLLDQLRQAAAAHAGKPAIVSENRAIAHGELVRDATACAGALARLQDERATLGLYVRNPIDFVVGYLAAAGARKRIVLLDPRLKGPDLLALMLAGEVTHLLYAQAEMLPAAPAHAAIVHERAAGIGAGLAVAPAAPGWLGDEFSYLPGDFMVHSSSGSMGRPKAIVCTQESIWHRIRSWTDTVGLGPSDVTLCTLTLSHCHGIDMLMLPPLFSGGLVVAPDIEKVTPRRVVSLWAEHGVTVFSSLPYIYEMILASVPREKVKLDTLRYIVSASAPLSEETATGFRRAFGRSLNQAYGMSEIGCILLARDGSAVGRVGDFVAGVEGRIAEPDEQGIGDLVVRGPGMARGYLKSPEAQREMFRDGWLWTQDLVSRDAGGFMIRGRKSRFINFGGNKVDPGEVEQALRGHPRVEEAVVMGVRDSLAGERVVAFVKPSGPAPGEAALREHLGRTLASYKLPSRYVFVDAIPRTSLGKVRLDVLRRSAMPAGLPGN